MYFEFFLIGERLRSGPLGNKRWHGDLWTESLQEIFSDITSGRKSGKQDWIKGNFELWCSLNRGFSQIVGHPGAGVGLQSHPPLRHGPAFLFCPHQSLNVSCPRKKRKPSGQLHSTENNFWEGTLLSPEEVTLPGAGKWVPQPWGRI